MPNLVGIGNSQVPTNAMLGGLAYQDPSHANLTNVEIEKIAAIKAKLGETATDIFVYDTRKDSDGGAWRKRTKDTSWYNQINDEGYQHIRGSRREFPSIAVIVAASTGVYIYDGDDPNLSLWMRFKTAGGGPIYTNPQIVRAINGTVFVSSNASPSGAYVSELAFIHDAMRLHQDSGKNQVRNTWVTGMTPSGSGTAWIALVKPINISNSFQLEDRNAKDMAVIVRPNAPIDDVSGLPRPTIAVAQEAGVSIVRDDGSVIDKLTSSAHAFDVEWMGPDRLAFSAPLYYGIFNTPLDHQSTSYISGISDSNYIHGTQSTYSWSSSPASPHPFAGATSKLVSLDSTTIANNSTSGLDIRQLSSNSGVADTSGMVAGIATNYNTGWILGDVRGAWLADTATTSLDAGTNLLTVGTFASSTGWTLSDTAAPTISGGTLNFDGTAGTGLAQRAETPAVITSDLTYTVKMVVTRSAGTLQVRIGNGSYSNTISSSGTYTLSVKSGSTPTETILFYGNSFNGTVDNVEIYLEDQDRSVHNTTWAGRDATGDKLGLRPVGGLTRQKVALGADLSSVSGFSASNYLTFDASTMNFGYKNFSFICWCKPVDNGENDFLIEMNDASGSDRFYVLTAGGSGSRKLYVPWNVNVSGSDMPIGEWSQVVVGRSGDNCYVYVNGKLAKMDRWGSNKNFTTAGYGTIGNYSGAPSSGYAWGGEIALVRIAGTMPTEEQVRKMYYDEKQFFKENAKCTLYGTSSDVKAIAYDDSTNTLHAGTSSGRSDFRGLSRINNTTTAVTTAISASNGLIAEQ